MHSGLVAAALLSVAVAVAGFEVGLWLASRDSGWPRRLADGLLWLTVRGVMVAALLVPVTAEAAAQQPQSDLPTIGNGIWDFAISLVSAWGVKAGVCACIIGALILIFNRKHLTEGLTWIGLGLVGGTLSVWASDGGSLSLMTQLAHK